MQTNIVELIGHALGFVSVALFFYSYQRSQKSTIVVIQTVATALSCIQYLLIGAYSGFALNVVCIIRNFAFYYRDKKQITGLVVPFVFALLMAVACVPSWEGPNSLLITLGLAFNTVCMGVFDAKKFRKTILVSSTLILIYNIFASSYSGMLSESISLISAVIGIIRYRKTQQPSETEESTAQ